MSSIKVTQLDENTSDSVVDQLGQLYQLVSPDNPDCFEVLGHSMRSSAIDHLERRSKLKLEDKCPARYYLIHREKQLLGYGLFQIELEVGLPTTCYCYIFIHPDFRRQGVGTTLLQQMLTQFHKSDLHSIFFFAEDNAGREFLVHNSGTITEHSITQAIQLEVKDSIPQVDEIVEISLNPNPDDLEEFMKVYNTAKLDEPRGNDDRYQVMSAEEYHNIRHKYAVNHLTGSLYRDGRIVAVTDMMQTRVENKLFQLFTGTLPEYRRKNLATQLKYSILRWLQQNKSGWLPVSIETSTLIENKAMQKVNKNIGYDNVGEELTIEFFNR